MKPHLIEKDIGDYLDSVDQNVLIEEGSYDPRRVFFLRPSSFPYCPLRSFLDMPNKLDRPKTSTLSSSYFTRVGTTTHEVFQEFTGRKGKIVGDWQCKCGKTKKFDVFSLCKCGQAPKYVELELSFMNTLLGHTDSLFRVTPSLGKKSVHAIIDYKTTSSRTLMLDKQLRAKGKKPKLPYKSNVAQIETYVPLTEEQYNIKVDYWILIYLARDAPFKYGRRIVVMQMSEDDKRRVKAKVVKSVKLHRRALKAVSPKDVEVLKKHKMCKSRADYEKNWHDEYNECPYAKDCFTEKIDTVIKNSFKEHKVFPLIEQAPTKIRKELGL